MTGGQGAAGCPVSPQDFAAIVARLGPFERPPAIAIAVSGGSDSMALALLAAEWAGKQKGSAVGLTVDHRLRPESRKEARQVAAWLGARGIAHKTLAWTGEKPSAGLQAAAREKRYALLEDWCRRNAILHLLLAHNLEDQAETFLLRLGRGSGLYGLAGMAEVEFRRGLRIVRPLLTIPRARLVATLKARGQEWIEDPSNRDEKFRRVRARRVLAGLAPEGLEAGRIAAAAEKLRRAREAIERDVTEALVEAATIHPEGYARLDPAVMMAGSEEVSLRALARILMTVSGQVYPPRFERLSQLHAELSKGLSRGRTLHGCRVMPATGSFRTSRFSLVVAREMSAIGDPVVLAPGRSAVWDGRFRVALGRGAQIKGKACTVKPLNTTGWSDIRHDVTLSKHNVIPAAARSVLPAFYDADGIVAVPHLGFVQRTSERAENRFSAAFDPVMGLGS